MCHLFVFPSNYYLMPSISIYNQSDAVIVPSEQMRDKLLAEADCEQDFDPAHVDHLHDLPLHISPAHLSRLLQEV